MRLPTKSDSVFAARFRSRKLATLVTLGCAVPRTGYFQGQKLRKLLIDVVK